MKKKQPAKTAEAAAVKDEKPSRQEQEQAGGHRGFVAEWTVTILLLLFGTTTLLQAFVVPTGSMEDTVLIGDHMFVDKLAYSPPGPVSKYLLPYTDVKRGDIIVSVAGGHPSELRQARRSAFPATTSSWSTRSST